MTTFKMSVISGLGDMISNLEDAITKEKDRLEKDIQSALNFIISRSETDFKNLYGEIETFTKNQGSAIEKDFEDIETLFEDIGKKIERTADEAYHTFVSKAESELAKIENSATKALNDIETASNYIRTKAPQELRSVISSAKNEFDAIRNAFISEIAKISGDIISKTKLLLEEIKNGTINDIEKLNSLRKSIDGELSSKFKDIEDVFSKIKNGAEKELDAITKLVVEEGKKLESKISNLKSDLRAGAIYVSIAAVLVGAAAALMIVALKERQHTLELEEKSNCKK